VNLHRKLLHEPLFHFLVLGALIFVVFEFASKDESDEPQRIVVTQGQIASLITGFSRTWQRPPTAAELDGLIRDYIHEEVAAREAKALGLDKDDTVIRRRLRQKLEFIAEDVVAQAQPTEEQLQKYLADHPEAFRSEQRLSFSQVYLDPQRHGENLTRDAVSLLGRLQQAGDKADISALGESSLLDQHFEALATTEVSKQFGEKFTAELGNLPVGQWQGPIESGYGVHLVLIVERKDGRSPALDEVRAAVQREWANAQRLEANEKFYEGLLQRYTVTIQQPQIAAAEQDKQRVKQ
jgi:PPIC-type PPIASE domain